jgi:hypothetical protein
VEEYQEKVGDILRVSRFKVGDGARTKFWHDLWCGDSVLKEVFPALFGIARRRMPQLRRICSFWAVPISET